MSVGAMAMANGNEFEQLLHGALRARGAATAPAGLEQRLLARLRQEDREPVTMPVAPRWSFDLPQQASLLSHASSVWFALGAHVAAIAIIAVLMANHVQLSAPAKPQMTVELLTPPPPTKLLPNTSTAGGGGGHHDIAAASPGHLPKFAPEQIVPPMAPPTIPPKLAVEPTLVVQQDLKMAENTMPNIGMPNSNARGVSLGNGLGTGIGSGEGAGAGNGTGANSGGGVLHFGGSIKPPVPIYQPEAEFSEEARRAKFSGNVEVYLWVDENGNPSHIRVAKGVGMGLDEKAIEAVRQYKFKPATQNGKPVKVDVYIDVDFKIL